MQKKKPPCGGSSKILLLGELILADAADRADKIGRELLSLGAGRDAVLRIALGLVVLIAADIANILLHDERSFLFYCDAALPGVFLICL